MVKIARKRNDTELNRLRTICLRAIREYMLFTIALVAFVWWIAKPRGHVGGTASRNGNATATALVSTGSSEAATAATKAGAAPEPVSYKTPLAYGTKGLKEDTAMLVSQAIGEGFRHVVTGGHHQSHNESGVGHGWKESGIDRGELFLQTCFVPFGSKEDFEGDPLDPESLPESIEEEVRLSVSISLKNLRTDYIDALVFHNFRAKRWDDKEFTKAWGVMEQLVDEGTVKHLGVTSVHDAEWFEKFYEAARIKPVIVQNRFHSNRKYDVPMQEVFAKHDIQVQRFWLLNGSSGFGKANKDMAKAKGVTPAQLMLGFVMSMGSETCLVGTKSQQHMQDDIEIAKCYPSLFWGETSSIMGDDEERKTYAKKLGMRRPNEDTPLPGWEGRDTRNGRSCRSTTGLQR